MFGSEISLMTLAMLGVLFVIAHVALLISTRWFNVMIVVAAGFLLLSPASAASEFPLVQPAKYGRVYCTLLLLLLGVTVARSWNIRPVAVMYLVFAGLFAVSGLWSATPIDALKYKGLYVIVVLGGYFTAYSLRGTTDFRDMMRLFGLAAAAFAAFIMLQLVANPNAISHVGRLAAWGLNGNRIGQTAAPMLAICAYLALYDPKKFWKFFGYGVGTLIGMIIIYTGSRGAAGEGFLACLIIGVPLVRRPGIFILVSSFVALTIFAVFQYSGASDLEAGQRLFSFSMETREAPWTEARDAIREAPVFGNGWIFHENKTGSASTENMHSIYMQVLVDTGMVGLSVLLIAILIILVKCRRTYREMKYLGAAPGPTFFTLGMIAAILIHGIFEAGTVTGSMVNSLLLPICIGLLDRLPEIAADEIEEAAWETADGLEDDPYSVGDLAPA